MNSQEQKRLLMDLDINMRTVDCFYTVTFYGALFREVRPWCVGGWVGGGGWAAGRSTGCPTPPSLCTPAPLSLAAPLSAVAHSGPQQMLAEHSCVPDAGHRGSETTRAGFLRAFPQDPGCLMTLLPASVSLSMK